MQRKWYYLIEDKAHGPVTWDKIKKLYSDSYLTAQSKVWNDEFEDWQVLSDLLSDLDQTVQVPPPLPTTKSPPPLPDTKNYVSIGPIQSKEDLITSRFLTKVSYVVFSLLLFGSVYALLQNIEETTNSSEVTTTETFTDRWPTAFTLDRDSIPYHPQIPTLNQSLVEDIYHTVGFRLGQEYAISELSEMFPSLRRSFLIQQYSFSSEFGSAYALIDSIMSSHRPSWENDKNEILNSTSKRLTYDNFTLNDAKTFLNEVENRSQGNLPSPVLETLLTFHPKYINNPSLLFRDDYTYEFRSKDLNKANGVDIAFEIPANWEASEGRRPHVVQKFMSESGNGLDIVMLLIFGLEENMPESVVYEFRGEDLWDESFPNFKTIDAGNVRIAQKPSHWQEFTGDMNQAGIELSSHGLGFVMIDGASMIHIMYMSAMPKDKSKNSLKHKYVFKSKMFQQVINSVEFYDRYE